MSPFFHAGNLPYTRAMPGGWADEGALVRSMTVSWNCCPAPTLLGIVSPTRVEWSPKE
jgi:hypothetical protein